MLSIKINKSGRYISYCDDNWYETVPYPICRFSEYEALKVIEQMKRHYVYQLTVCDESGTAIINAGKDTEATVDNITATASNASFDGLVF